MNACACNSVSVHNGKDSLLHRLHSDSSRDRSVVVVIQGGDIVDDGRITPSIFSLCSVVADNGRQIYLSVS